MIQTVAKLTLTALLGASLMACSDDVSAKTDTSFDKVKNTNLVQKIEFDTQNTCIKVGGADLISLTLADGTVLSLQRDLIDFIHLSESGKSVDKLATSFDEVSQLSFNLPWGYDGEGCAKTVPVHVHKIDLPKAGKITDRFAPFKPTYTSIYAFDNFSPAELDLYFTSNPFEALNIGSTSLYRLGDVDASLFPEVRPRFLNEQYVARMKFMEGARVLPMFFKDTSVVAYVNDDNFSGFLNYGPSEYSSNNRTMTLQVKMSDDYSAVVGLNTSPERMAKFEDAAAAIELDGFHSTFMRLPYLVPLEDLGAVINAYSKNLREE